MDKFNNKFRIPSARLQSWDYGSNGAYFITICTKNRQHLFGEIVNIPVETPKLGVSINDVHNIETPKWDVSLNALPNTETPKLGVSTNAMQPTMQLNEMGLLAEKYWMEILIHFPFIELGNFVVMPNHTHGILIINKPDTVAVETPNLGVCDIETNAETPNLGVSAGEINQPKIGGRNEKWKPNTIGSIINQYKRIVTINARLIHADFAWQSRFHDHIIRNAQSFENIQNYIANNPLNWEKDKFYNNNG